MTIGIVAALVLVVLVIDLPLFVWWRERQRARERDSLLPAHDRASALVQRAVDAYRFAEAQEVRMARQDLWVRALMAASGESEAAAKAHVARAIERSEPIPTLQILLAQAAEKRERDLAIAVGPEVLTKNIAEARDTVMRLVPQEL